MDTSDINRYWAKVAKKTSNECWEWLGKARCGKSGLYGQFWLKGKNATPHRVGYQLAYGQFDTSLHVLHKCDNPICVNPVHMFLGTNEDNIKDKMSKGRWNGGRRKLTQKDFTIPCPRCDRFKRLVKGHCHACYITLGRQRGIFKR